MTEKNELLSASSAAKSAVRYLEEMIPQAKAIMLEEVEQETQGERTYWLITLSFDRDLSGLPGSLTLIAMAKRTYKTFRVDAATGGIQSMKIRQV